jgi:hypothetical protein
MIAPPGLLPGPGEADANGVPLTGQQTPPAGVQPIDPTPIAVSAIGAAATVVAALIAVRGRRMKTPATE